jgi:hypothetical protein
MSLKNNHICILICYNNYEHIVKCFESIKNLNFDFFIIENFSNNSHEIEKYFKKQKILRYVQFEKNITNNAVNIIKNDFKKLLDSYEYLTFSDCDLFSENSSILFEEIYKILEFDNIGVCCSSLSLDNLPKIPGANSWQPIPTEINDHYIDVNTGIHFMTIKSHNYKLLTGVNFLDSKMANHIRSNKLKWVATKFNKVIHLTWDLYKEDNEYFIFKKNNNHTLWNHSNKCNYRIIV